jgi:hypothetical protein
MKQTIFHGTEQETSYLLRAIERNCNCTRGLTGQLAVMCGAHRMLIDDQRALNGLLFARRIADQLVSEEQEARPALRHLHR